MDSYVLYDVFTIKVCVRLGSYSASIYDNNIIGSLCINFQNCKELCLSAEAIASKQWCFN